MSDGGGQPIEMVWADGCARPTNFFWARKAGEQWAEGEVIVLSTHDDRSGKSHRHYFACIRTAWENLPDHLTPEFPTTEKLRKYALIKAGHCNSVEYICDNPREARRMAAALTDADGFALVVIQGCVVTRFTAKSNAKEFQDKKAFQQSKEAVLEILAEMIGVTVKVLADEGRQKAGMSKRALKALTAPSPKLLPPPQEKAA